MPNNKKERVLIFLSINTPFGIHPNKEYNLAKADDKALRVEEARF